MSSATTVKQEKDKGHAMKGNNKKDTTKNKTVASSKVLELYNDYHSDGKTHGQFLSALQREGNYRTTDVAQDRLNRLSHYVSKTHGVRLKPLRSAPRLTHSTGSLLQAFDCLSDKA
mgnify:FL=1